jgi:glutathione S-transferase
MLILHGSNGSPFASRVRMQAYAKELPIELRPAALGTPEFQRMNPIGKMPVLEHDGFLVPESAVICEYLEEAFPTPSLLGATIQDRARVRLVMRTLDLYCGGTGELLRAAADPGHKIDVEAKRAELDKGLGAIDTFLAEDGYAVAGKLSLADCALVPWLFYGNMLTRSGDDALTRHARLSRYTAFIAEQALTKRIWGEMDESFRAFMSRWKAQQESAKAGAQPGGDEKHTGEK